MNFAWFLEDHDDISSFGKIPKAFYYLMIFFNNNVGENMEMMSSTIKILWDFCNI